MEAVEFQGQPPTKRQQQMLRTREKYWVDEVGMKAPVRSMEKVEDAAKQIIALTGTLQAIYFAVFSFGDLLERVPLPEGSTLWLLLPVVSWLLSLLFATFVFVPRVRSSQGADAMDFSPDAWKRMANAFQTTLTHKRRWLHLSHALLVIGFVATLVLMARWVAV